MEFMEKPHKAPTREPQQLQLDSWLYQQEADNN